jgi:hypothetical protein
MDAENRTDKLERLVREYLELKYPGRPLDPAEIARLVSDDGPFGGPAKVPAFGCVNNTIRLRSGRYFDLADPKPDQFVLEDIAGALAKICRFGGQIDRFYSVAQHLVLCVWQGERDGLPRRVLRTLGMHDGTEAFVGDVVKPLKIMLPAYDRIESRAWGVVVERFDLDVSPETMAAVKKIDREMLMAERKQLFSADGVKWTGEDSVRSLDILIDPWPPKQAELEFHAVCHRLGIVND